MGTGKTFTVFQIIWRLWRAEKVKRVLFLVDRNILADQTVTNDFKPFGWVMTKVRDHNMDPSYEVYDEDTDGGDDGTLIGDPGPPTGGATRYVISGFEVTVVAERVQYYCKDGRLITESLTDYTREAVKEKYATLTDFLRRGGPRAAGRRRWPTNFANKGSVRGVARAGRQRP